MKIKKVLFLLNIFLMTFALGVRGETKYPNDTSTNLAVSNNTISFVKQNLRFDWDLANDAAKVSQCSSGNMIWKGSLMPAWWLKTNGSLRFVKATLVVFKVTGNHAWTVRLKIGAIGEGTLVFSYSDNVLSFKDLTVNWKKPVPSIISMYFGAVAADPAKSAVPPVWDKPFLPGWQAAGFCVPGAKEGPEQSFFRNWDFGQANIALGSFGPSMGSPYAAAYPRPLLYAGMGDNLGFITLGAGSIPDGAMSLRVLGARGCFEYVYREDLWGAPKAAKRNWPHPLRLTIDETAWNSFRQYYASFPVKTTSGTNAVKPTWNTWGTWARNDFVIKPVVEQASRIRAQILVMDASWEEKTGSARVYRSRFPQFDQETTTSAMNGMGVGFWQSVGWISDPKAEGLAKDELILNRYGKPCKTTWNFDPSGESYYCLDPSSAKARQFIEMRTERIMKTYHPKLLKLDFGYGLPSPDMGVPRNPAYRGEKYAYALLKCISDAAKKIDPDVAIMYYSISPLWTGIEDVVLLDDQGDLWNEIKTGHASWSIWASLLGTENTAICASSGYDWEKDDEAILNTAILGVPGAVLPVDGTYHQAIPPRYLNRRLAINSWFRRTTQWEPLWLTSKTGDFVNAPELNSWARLEKKDTSRIITALVLREENEKIRDDHIVGIDFNGRWALIAQDDNDIRTSSRLALIPFDAGDIAIPLQRKPKKLTVKNLDGDRLFTGWNWDGSHCIIKIDKEMLENTAGFLIDN